MKMRVKKGPTVSTLFAQSVSTREPIVNCEDFQHSWKASESDSLRDEVCFSSENKDERYSPSHQKTLGVRRCTGLRALKEH